MLADMVASEFSWCKQRHGNHSSIDLLEQVNPNDYDLSASISNLSNSLSR